MIQTKAENKNQASHKAAKKKIPTHFKSFSKMLRNSKIYKQSKTCFLIFQSFFTAPPIFLVEPTDQKVAEGAPASLDCIASGNPTPTLFWIKESSPGIILPATTNGHMTVTPEGTLRIGKRLKNV